METKRPLQDVKIVLGAFFGDEAKGNTVQWLCKQAIAEGKRPCVVRFSGGPQAGHRVVHNGISHICSSYGSGVLLGVPTIWDPYYNIFIDPCAIQLERQVLIKETGKNPGVPYIQDPEICRYVHPYDILSNKSNEKTIKDGTCGKGIYACYKRYEGFDPAVPYEDDFDRIIRGTGYSYEDSLKDCYPDIKKDKVLENTFKDDYNLLIRETKAIDYNLIENFDTVIFEGSQGLLLDMDNGFMPHCTPSNTGLQAILPEFITDRTEVYLVMRTYLTRHGNGYEPKYDEIMRRYINVPDEPSNLDTGYQGKFKTGILDINLFNRAIDRHHLDNYPCKFNIVLTHCDCLKEKKVPFYYDRSILDANIEGDLKWSLFYHSLLNIDKIFLFDKEEM